MARSLTQLARLRKPFLLTAAAAVAAAPAPRTDSAADVGRAWSALEKHQDDFWLKPEPGAPALLEAWYGALRRWTAAALAQGNPPSALAREAKRLDKSLRVQALPLPGGIWIVSADNQAFGEVFALAPRDGGLAETWRLSLPSWRADRARDVCPAEEECGPLTGFLRILPPEADGSPRFLVFGTYTTPMGATVGGQLSLWRWRRGGAEPLLVKSFAYMIDERDPILTVAGGEVRLRVKEDWQHMFACGGCSGRQVEWRWRLTGSGIEPIGSRPVFRELELIDALIGRVVKGARTGDLAVPAAAEAVRRLRRENADPQAPDGMEAGMLMGWTRVVRGRETLVCLSADGFGIATYRFRDIAGRLRLVAVVPRRIDDACGKHARH
jgi:hypothetical protein